MTDQRQLHLTPIVPCSHPDVEEVRSQGGDTIGVRCSNCLTLIYAIGHCDGCGRDQRALIHYVASIDKRFCSEQCRVDERNRRMGREP